MSYTNITLSELEVYDKKENFIAKRINWFEKEQKKVNQFEKLSEAELDDYYTKLSQKLDKLIQLNFDNYFNSLQKLNSSKFLNNVSTDTIKKEKLKLNNSFEDLNFYIDILRWICKVVHKSNLEILEEILKFQKYMLKDNKVFNWVDSFYCLYDDIDSSLLFKIKQYENNAV